MRNEKYVIFCIGLALGCILTSFAQAVQPQEIKITFEKPIEAKLKMEDWRLEALK